ncbi:hypothetical protein PRIPAC_97054 [Pristionchus pacificus]|uniref:G protein-coupled receptor n=1 Tax=Pristionchus pacificus TaxID=54126 RepID=A0A2A6BCD4_PRIPA|nr:hypothetical protein PRIPAC_97054 [Pristionchus pacificus]|eukprot:PDM63550.1 G protein-coupled receptor [Pristionchus pacificus]
MFIVDRILLYTSLVITSFTIPIYAVVVNTILSTRYKCSFERTFFAIVAVGGISDTISLSANVVYILIILDCIHIPDVKLCAQIFTGISWSSRASTNLTDLLISLHRVTAVLALHKHAKIFTKKVVQFILVALVLIILSAFILGTLADSSWVKGTGSGPGRYIQPSNFTDHKQPLLGAQSVFAIVIVINYALLLITFRRELQKLKSTISSSMTAKHKKQSRMVLTKVAVTVCSLEILFLAYSLVSTYITIPFESNVAIYVFLSTIIVGSPSYSLLAFSSTLQIRIVERLRKLKPIRVDVISIQTIDANDRD